jgi:hypothetical protein
MSFEAVAKPTPGSQCLDAWRMLGATCDATPYRSGPQRPGVRWGWGQIKSSRAKFASLPFFAALSQKSWFAAVSAVVGRV